MCVIYAILAAYALQGRVALPKRMNFRKKNQRAGGWVISNPNMYIADFYKWFFGHEFRKKTAIWFSENEAGPKAVWNFSENSSLLVGPPVPHRLSYIQYIFWLPKVQALIKKTTICISSFILNSVSFVLQVCSIEFSFSELIEFCSIFTHFLRMEKECRWVHRPVYCFAYSVHNPGDIVYNTWDKDLCCNKPTTSRALCLDWKINKSTFFFFLVLIEIYWTKTSTIVIR